MKDYDTSAAIHKFAEAVEALRADMSKSYLLNVDSGLPCGGLGAMSEQHFLLALAALDTAKSNLTITSYLRARGD